MNHTILKTILDSQKDHLDTVNIELKIAREGIDDTTDSTWNKEVNTYLSLRSLSHSIEQSIKDIQTLLAL